MTITKEGSLASFYTVNKAPIKHLRVYFSPKQAGSGDPSPENVREISGWTEIRTAVRNENLLPMEMPDSLKKCTYSDGKIKTATNAQIFSTMIIKNRILNFQKKTSDTLAGGIIQLDNYYFDIGDSYKSPVGFTNLKASDITINDSQYIGIFSSTLEYINAFFTTRELMISLGSGRKKYVAPKGKDYITDWSSTLGTIYGGYVDLVTGELVEEWTSPITLGAPYLYANQLCFSFTRPANISTGSDPAYYSYLFDSFIAAKRAESGMSVHSGNGFCYIRSDGLSANNLQPAYIEQDGVNVLNPWWTEWYNALETKPKMVMTLAIPVVHQLTPTQLSTLIGQNNIWSNADRVEVEYDLAESNDELYRRRNIILSGYPHIDAASGNIANFQTDMIAPLKEAKIYFNPVQAGSGDPSPENVREIHGWNEISTIFTDNMMQIIPTSNLPLTTNGITLSYLGDSTFYLEGEYTEQTRFDFNIQPILFKQGYKNKIVIQFDPASTLAQSSPIAAIALRKADGTGGIGIRITEILPTRTYYTETSQYDHDIPIEFIRLVFPPGSKNIKLRFFVYQYHDNEELFTSTFNNTLYGGYVDLINGELVETYKYYNLGDLTPVDYGAASYDGNDCTNIMYYIIDTGLGYNANINKIFADQVKWAGRGTWSTPDSFPWQWCINANNQLHIVVVNSTVGITSDMTFAQKRYRFKSWLQEHPMTFVVPRKTPIHHSLSPQTLKTLKGTNNIWSNANGPIEVKYWTH